MGGVRVREALVSGQGVRDWKNGLETLTYIITVRKYNVSTLWLFE